MKIDRQWQIIMQKCSCLVSLSVFSRLNFAYYFCNAAVFGIKLSMFHFLTIRFISGSNQNGSNQGGGNSQGFLNWMNQGQGQDGQWPRPPPQQPQDKGFLKYD